MQNVPSFALHMEGIEVAEASDLNGKVTEMKRAGREVAALCVGEPDYDTADRPHHRRLWISMSRRVRDGDWVSQMRSDSQIARRVPALIAVVKGA